MSTDKPEPATPSHHWREPAEPEDLGRVAYEAFYEVPWVRWEKLEQQTRDAFTAAANAVAEAVATRLAKAAKETS